MISVARRCPECDNAYIIKDGCRYCNPSGAHIRKTRSDKGRKKGAEQRERKAEGITVTQGAGVGRPST